MRKQHAGAERANNSTSSNPSPVGKGVTNQEPEKEILPPQEIVPTAAELARIRTLKMDNTPDNNEPIVLSDNWYEFSVFIRKFNVSRNTAELWLKNGWLPYSQINRMRYINLADIERFMIKFRRSGPAEAVP